MTAFLLILTAELLLLAYLAIPYAWESFIAFGQDRYDTHFGAYGDVPAVPGEMRPARKLAEGGVSEQGGRAGTGDGRTHHGRASSL